MKIINKQIIKLIGPIILSALSIFLSFLILQPVACWLDPSFNLLSSRSIGKIAFIFLIIFQIFLFLTTLSTKFFKLFLKTNFYFFAEKNWFKKFFCYFIIFFIFHSFILLFLFKIGFINYNPLWGKFTLSVLLKVFIGFIATFFLAWTEELIFRGTIYLYFVQKLNPITSLFFTSSIFMFSHNLLNPGDLITKNWKLGLGLFLLGTLLNLIFIITRKLYTGMGAHAGLVFVKVLLRKIPILTFITSTKLPFWINKDLRMAPLTHVLFLIVILVLGIKNYKKLINLRQGFGP